MSTNRLLNRILRDEERADRIEVNLNVHLQSYAKNVGRIQDDFNRVVEKINTCDDRVDVFQQRHVNQESFNRAILERMQDMEATIEGQTERIVSLEEEVVTLCWKKACTCHWGRGPMEMGVYMLGTFQALSQSSSNVPTRYISFTFQM